MEHLSRLLAVLIIVFVNGFFVAAEFALVKVRAAQLQPLVDKGNRRARMAQSIVLRLDEYLSACQIGITIASLALGWVGEPFIARYLRPVLHVVGIHSETMIHTTSVAIAFGIITFLHIVLGELAPKSLAIRQSLTVSLNSAHALRLFYLAAYPFIYVLNGTAIFLLKIVGIGIADEGGRAHSSEELRALLEYSGKAGELSRNETRMLEKVFEFHGLEAHQIIVPRPDIVYLLAESDVDDNLAIAEKCGHTRFPLCEGSIDQVIGFIHVKDLYRAARRNGGPVNLLDVKREILFFPEHSSLDRILREFQKRKVHLGIVIDEYGGTLGMLTLEDVIEELVGEIQDEFDHELPSIQRVGKLEFLVDGSCPINEFEKMTGLELPDTEADTVAGIVLEKAGDLPKTGEEIKIDGGKIVVERIEEQRIKRVRFVRVKEKPGA